MSQCIDFLGPDLLDTAVNLSLPTWLVISSLLSSQLVSVQSFCQALFRCLSTTCQTLLEQKQVRTGLPVFRSSQTETDVTFKNQVKEIFKTSLVTL